MDSQTDTSDLLATARQRSFETYLRFGRHPATGASAFNQKALEPLAPLPPEARRPTRFYVWRTADDARVRHSHAARDGKIFAWAEAPGGGHPGSEPNCRCWAEPYYGDPSIPDMLQPLRHAYRTDTSGSSGWSSIETLTRPDGSIAQSIVVALDGTRIDSRFSATNITRLVVLPNGQTVRADTVSGLQSIYFGTEATPLFQSRWTSSGPRVVRARQHLAFLLDRDPLDSPALRDPREVFEGNGGGGGGSALAAIASALTALFVIQQAAPASQGLGESDEPVLAMKAWTVNENRQPIPLLVGSLTEERLREYCRFLPDVQSWTDEAALALSAQKPIMPARTWGVTGSWSNKENN